MKMCEHLYLRRISCALRVQLGASSFAQYVMYIYNKSFLQIPPTQLSTINPQYQKPLFLNTSLSKSRIKLKVQGPAATVTKKRLTILRVRKPTSPQLSL